VTAKRKRAAAKRKPARSLPRFYGPGELTDVALLPKRFELHAAEVRDSFKLLGDRILPTITRVEEQLTSLTVRVGELEQAQHRTDDRLAALEAAQQPKQPE